LKRVYHGEHRGQTEDTVSWLSVASVVGSVACVVALSSRAGGVALPSGTGETRPFSIGSRPGAGGDTGPPARRVRPTENPRPGRSRTLRTDNRTYGNYGRKDGETRRCHSLSLTPVLKRRTPRAWM